QQRETYRQASNERAEAERKQRECQASFWCRNGQKVKDFGSDIGNWAVQNADVVGVIAGVAVGLTCTVVTGGSGALLCGALGGAVSGLVSGGLKCAGGNQNRCSAGSLALDLGIGAVLGLAGGAAGAALGGAISGLFAASLRGAASGARSAIGGLGRGTVTAARQGTPASISRRIGGSPNKNLGKFVEGSRQQWAKDVKNAGGGMQGHAAIALDTSRMLVQGAFTANGVAGGTVGAIAPTTRDDVKQLWREGYSFNPATGVPQIVGGLLGGGFN
ncbi:hypothetical protein ACFY2A_28890, partial [Micromonospora sp. NPDC000442]